MKCHTKDLGLAGSVSDRDQPLITFTAPEPKGSSAARDSRGHREGCLLKHLLNAKDLIVAFFMATSPL